MCYRKLQVGWQLQIIIIKSIGFYDVIVFLQKPDNLILCHLLFDTDQPRNS